MKIGISGASGFVGRNLQWRLREYPDRSGQLRRVQSGMSPGQYLHRGQVLTRVPQWTDRVQRRLRQLPDRSGQLWGLRQGVPDPNAYIDAAVRMALASLGCSPDVANQGVAFSTKYLHDWITGAIEGPKPAWTNNLRSDNGKFYAGASLSSSGAHDDARASEGVVSDAA